MRIDGSGVICNQACYLCIRYVAHIMASPIARQKHSPKVLDMNPVGGIMRCDRRSDFRVPSDRSRNLWLCNCYGIGAIRLVEMSSNTQGWLV